MKSVAEILRIILLVLLSFAWIFQTYAQNPDSILANETTLSRPLTVHSGQLRITGGYGFLVNSKRYDVSGTAVDLSEEGLTNIGHLVNLRVDYGFTEFLQGTIAINHIQQGQRSRSITIIAVPDDPIDFNEVVEQKGWSDIDLALALKLPIVTKSYDVSLTLGRSFTTGAHEPDQPEHQIENQNGFNNITYRFSEKAGWGVSSWYLAFQGKIRANSLAFSLSYEHRHFPDIGQNIRWNGYLEDGDILYDSFSYEYQLGDRSGLEILAEYQAWPFLNVFSGYRAMRVGEGWSGISGQRVLENEQSRNALLFGAEVLITPKLWLRQEVSLPTGGENSLNPLILSTKAVYNLFPFKK